MVDVHSYLKQCKVELAAQQQKTNHYKILAHQELVAKHKRLFYWMDVFVALALLLNLGAATITNMLVVKQEPQMELLEVNPTVADTNNYVEHPRSSSLFKALLSQLFLWALLIAAYLYHRLTIHTHFALVVLYIVVACAAFIFAKNFANDFGYYLGRLIYGG